MTGINDEYVAFMEWFSREHPVLHEKYGRNISIPFEIGGGVTVTPMYKISQKEQDFVTLVANSYYNKMMDTPIDSLEFEYKKGVRVSQERETIFRSNITSWLKEISHLINRQKGVIKVVFIDEFKNHVIIENVDDSIVAAFNASLKRHGH